MRVKRTRLFRGLGAFYNTVECSTIRVRRARGEQKNRLNTSIVSRSKDTSHIVIEHSVWCVPTFTDFRGLVNLLKRF